MNISAKQRLVYSVIKNNPEIADDDARLLEAVWLKEGWDDTKSLFYNLSRVTRPETISRRRRELYNMGLIRYSEKALRRRTEAFRAELEQHSNNELMRR